MKRSTHVAAPLLAAAALALNSGCRKPEMQRCVDEHNVVVDDSHCANLPAIRSRTSPTATAASYPSSFPTTTTTAD